MRLSLIFKYIAMANVVVTAASVQAQQAESTQSRVQVIEEIVVTAQRREENLQSVPIAVTVLSAEFMDENEIRSLSDLAGTVPGLVTTRSAGYGIAPLSIRGIGGANGGGNVFADEPVATYLNGIYIGPPAFNSSELLDVDSIQVLRGPQGTLYGRNATAGAVLITTKKPGDEFEGEFRASVTDLDEVSISVAVGGPLSSRFGGRLALSGSDRDGFGVNTVNGDDIGGSENLSGRATLTFEASNSLSFEFIAEYTERETDPALHALTALGQTGGFGSPFVLRADLDDVLESDEFANDEQPNGVDSNDSYYTLSARWEISDQLTLDSITGYISREVEGMMDSDGTGLELFSNSAATDSELFSQEFRLSGQTESIDWAIGFFYLYDAIDFDFSIINQTGGPPGFASFPPAGPPIGSSGLDIQFDTSNKTEAYALFFDTTFSLSEKLNLTLGGRWSSEEKDFTNQVQTFNLRSFPFIPGLPPSSMPGTSFGITPVAEKESFNDFSPRIVVDYLFSDDTVLYASYSQAFKSGGFNAFGTGELVMGERVVNAFNPEGVDAFEIGSKSTFFNQRVRLNLSAYSYDYEDLQLRLPVATGGVDIANVDEAEITGFEVELTAVLSEHLTIAASYTYLDATITEGALPAIPTDVAPFVLGTLLNPNPIMDEDISGNDITRAPEHAYNINARYERDLGPVYGAFVVTYRWQDSVFFLETNQDANTFRADSWSELDLRLSISSHDERWELAVYGQNILDERYIAQVSAFGAFPNASVNEPRKWGLQLIAKF